VNKAKLKELQTKYCLSVITDKKFNLGYIHPSDNNLRSENKKIVFNKIILKYSKLINGSSLNSNPVDSVDQTPNSNPNENLKPKP